MRVRTRVTLLLAFFWAISSGVGGCGGGGGGRSNIMDPPIYYLTILKSGTGKGIVESPAGFFCDQNCNDVTYGFDEDTVISMTATPAAGSVFVGWSDSCGGTAPCSVIMDFDKSVTAIFELE